MKQRISQEERAEKRRQLNQEYYAKNRERLIAAACAYYKKWKGRTRPTRKLVAKEEKLKKRRTRERKMKASYGMKSKEWKKSHASEIKAYSAAYSKSYYQKHKKEILEYAEKYRLENKEAIAKKIKAHHIAHPEKQRVRGQKYKARKKKATIGDTKPIEKWEKAWRRKRKVNCFWCSKQFSPKDCHSDHILALKLGGEHRVENLCISCRTCNTGKQAKTVAQWNAKLSQPVLL